MTVPDFQTLMLPVLRQLAASGEQAPADVREAVASNLGLSSEDLSELLPSGRQTTFANRVAWASWSRQGVAPTGLPSVAERRWMKDLIASISRT
jgi:restriction endonuclease Mrr